MQPLAANKVAKKIFNACREAGADAWEDGGAVDRAVFPLAVAGRILRDEPGLVVMPTLTQAEALVQRVNAV